jgi:[acyl-carrier-protein] S-malonyltransferase
MKRAYIFPGQGSQFAGMGKGLYDGSASARALFEQANDILGFSITDVMFYGSDEDLRQTRVTQPAVFLHSVVIAKTMNDFAPDMAAGHSLGEFSALTAAGALDYADGLRLVALRAQAMQKACEAAPSAMAAILGLSNDTIEKICAQITEEVAVPANYNCDGQLVISGSIKGIAIACERMLAAGAKRAIKLNVGGAFHSPLMHSAKEELAAAINQAKFMPPRCPVYQNVDALPHTNPDEIKRNLIAQLTAPVRWTQIAERMAADGAQEFIEVGPGSVLQGLIKKTIKNAMVSGIQ